jgi:hypothetical protein
VSQKQETYRTGANGHHRYLEGWALRSGRAGWIVQAVWRDSGKGKGPDECGDDRNGHLGLGRTGGS